MWREAKNYSHHRNTCQTRESAERNRFRACKHREDAREKGSRVDAKSNPQVLQRSGAIASKKSAICHQASEKLALCHLPVVRAGQERTTVQRSEAIAQLAWSLSDFSRLTLLEKTALWESKGSCDRFQEKSRALPSDRWRVEPYYGFALAWLLCSRTRGSGRGSLRQHKPQFCQHNATLSAQHGTLQYQESTPTIKNNLSV